MKFLFTDQSGREGEGGREGGREGGKEGMKKAEREGGRERGGQEGGRGRVGERYDAEIVP